MLFTFLLVCAIEGLFAVILKVALQEIAKISRTRERLAKRLHRSPLPKGTPAPRFSAIANGLTETIDSSTLKGHLTILMFVAPDETHLSRYSYLANVLHALWHKSQGHLYLLCRGDEVECQQLAAKYKIGGSLKHEIKLLLDEEGQIGDLFRIRSTPHAVEIDKHGRIARYGRPSMSDVEDVEHIELA
jgi:hypothetical protein